MRYKKDNFTKDSNMEDGMEFKDSDYSLDAEVISEMIIIKREILQSFFDALKSLKRVYRSSILNKDDEIAKANFCEQTFSLFFKLRPLITEYQIGKLPKNDRPIFREMIKDIETSLLEGKIITFDTWKKYYMNMQTTVRKLNIYGIGFVKDDPEKAWMSGMTE